MHYGMKPKRVNLLVLTPDFRFFFLVSGVILATLQMQLRDLRRCLIAAVVKPSER